MPYDIDTLTKIRHECFRYSLENPGQQMSNPVFQPPEPLRNGRNRRNRKVKMQRTQTSYSKPVRTRSAAIRARATKTSATITQATTFVELKRPRLIQFPHNDFQFASLSSGSPMSTLSSPELYIESPIESPNFQTVGEPITMTTTATSETDVVYQIECSELNESIPCYVITSDEPITVEYASAELVPQTGSQIAVQTDVNQLAEVSCFLFDYYFLLWSLTILHCFSVIYCRIFI